MIQSHKRKNYLKRHCLVNLRNWRLTAERLMRSLEIMVVNEQHKTLVDTQPTANP